MDKKITASITVPQREVPATAFDVVVVGGGTGGVLAATAAARMGARTVLIEGKGYVGGTVVEGGTALHSFYNNWKAFPGREKTQIIRGLPQELIDRLMLCGGCTGHCEMDKRFEYDSVCTAIDTELYKLTALEMLEDAGVTLYLNTMLTGAVVQNGNVQAALLANHAGPSAVVGKVFIDCTGYGDLCAHAGAQFIEPNDHEVANSMGVGGVDVEKYLEFFQQHDALTDLSRGLRDGRENQIIRIDARHDRLPKEFLDGINEIGMSTVITTTHDDYFMFIKLNCKLPHSPTDRDTVTAGESLLRKNQRKAIELLRRFVPGCKRAFIARTSPALCIRRGRIILCDYDITNDDIIHGRHFEDDVFTYGFHDEAPRFDVNRGGTYGFPYRAMLPKGLENLFATGMMISTDWHAHMSTRNTVSCMAQGQAAGTAAALCVQKGLSTRSLPYALLRRTLVENGVYLEPEK